MAAVGLDCNSLTQVDSQPKSVGLVWSLATTGHLVCIHWDMVTYITFLIWNCVVTNYWHNSDNDATMIQPYTCQIWNGSVQNWRRSAQEFEEYKCAIFSHCGYLWWKLLFTLLWH